MIQRMFCGVCKELKGASIGIIAAAAVIISFTGIFPDNSAATEISSSPLNRPGRLSINAPPVSPSAARSILSERYAETRELISETDPTPEITALARALENDPLVIYNYIHNHFDYVPTFGSVNGATAALHAGRGNDWDLASLFIALMRESGYEANYVTGDVRYGRERLAEWAGVENDMNVIMNVFASGGVPIQAHPPQGEFTLMRVWAIADVGGTEYVFDAAMKEYDYTAGINTAAAMSYNQSDFLTGALEGATVGSDFVQDVNEANVRTALETYSMNLTEYIRTNMPTAGVDEVIGGRSIAHEEASQYSTELPFAVSVSNEVEHSEIPQQYRHTVRIEHEGIDRTFNTYEIAGRRFTLFYTGTDYAPQLYLDGTAEETGNPTSWGNRYDMTVTIDHPYAASGGTYADQSYTFQPLSGSSYSISASFENVSQDLTAVRGKELSRAIDEGGAPGSEAVLGESLNIMGLHWFLEERQFGDIVGMLGQMLFIKHHIIGLVGQETGYYIDVPMSITSAVSKTGEVQDQWTATRSRILMSSAFEHGMLEQKQGSDKPAVSTIKLLKINNEAGDKTFLAETDNWTSVQNELYDYNQGLLNFIESYINAGYQVILPANGGIDVNDWHGTGLILYYYDGSGMGMGMMISGAIYGGWSTYGDMIDAGFLDMAEQGINGQGPGSVALSGEPVDMSTGAFRYETTDISFGEGGPMGITFQRYYNGADNYRHGPLGAGWSHNYDVQLDVMSNGGLGLGERMPADAASTISGAAVLFDLLTSDLGISEWAITSLVSQWIMDGLIDNAVLARIGRTTYMFSKLADESYTTIPDAGYRLHKDGETFKITDPFGGCYEFDSLGAATAWKDANDNTMNFFYDGEGRLDIVSDSFGRSIELDYEYDYISQITDLETRTISYEYSDDCLTDFTDLEGEEWVYSYDSEGRMTAMTKPLGNTVVTNIYDELGRVEYQEDAYGTVFNVFYFSGHRNIEEDAFGNRIIHFFNEEGRLVRRCDAAGASIYFEYDGLGQLTKRIDRLGGITEFTYHLPTGEAASRTNAEGHTTSYTFEERPYGGFTFYKLTRIDYPDGTYEQYMHDPNGNIVSYRNRGGKTSTQTFDSRGLLLTNTNHAGGINSFTYNSDGTMATSHDPETGTTSYEYDELGRNTKIFHPPPDDSYVEMVLDDQNRLRIWTDERGNSLIYSYDANGNLTTLTDAKGNSTQRQYDMNDRLEQLQDRRGKTASYVYDAMGRLSAVTDPNGLVKETGYTATGWENRQSIADRDWLSSYDDEGVIASETSPEGRTTTYISNDLGFILFRIDPLGHHKEFVPDEMNRTVEIIDELDRAIEFEYNGWDKLDSVTMPEIGTAFYARNDLGSIQQLTDLNGENWLWEYSDMNRLTSLSDPLGNEWSHTYDHRGRLDVSTYPEGGTQVRSYDAAGNILQQSFTGGPTIDYTYDGDLNLLLETNNISFDYDEEEYFIETTLHGETFGAAYDDGGRLASVTYADGLFTVEYDYDPLTGDLMQVSDTLAGAQADLTYDDDGLITGIERSNGIETQYHYDDAGRLTRITHGTFAELAYTLDEAGQVIHADLTLPADPADYITAVEDVFTYDAASQVSSAGYAYDERGRLTGSPEDTYDWDGAGRMTMRNSVNFTYTGFGDLASRTETGDTMLYYFNYALGLSPIVAEKDEGTGQFVRYYVCTPAGRILYCIDASEGNAVYFYHFDRIGSTIALTDAAGAVTDSYAYTPYGSLLHHEGVSEQPFTFVGQWGVRQENQDGTLYHMRTRFYDAVTARFLSRDVIWPRINDPRLLNPYQYARNEPVDTTDVRGTQPDGTREAGNKPNQESLSDIRKKLRDIIRKFKEITVIKDFDTRLARGGWDKYGDKDGKKQDKNGHDQNKSNQEQQAENQANQPKNDKEKGKPVQVRGHSEMEGTSIEDTKLKQDIIIQWELFPGETMTPEEWKYLEQHIDDIPEEWNQDPTKPWEDKFLETDSIM